MDRFTDAFRAELSAFVDVVIGTAAPACSVADAVEVAWLAEAAAASLGRGVPVGIQGGDHNASLKIAGAPISWGVCEVPGLVTSSPFNACSPRCVTSGWPQPNWARRLSALRCRGN